MDAITPILISAGVVVALGFLAVLFWKPMRTWQQHQEAEQAMQAFRLQREQLEAKFFDLAGSRGVPRGLRWLECD